MRMIVAAALAASFAGAAFAAEPAKVITAVEKTSAVTQQVDRKEWAQAQCWVCLPWVRDKQ